MVTGTLSAAVAPRQPSPVAIDRRVKAVACYFTAGGPDGLNWPRWSDLHNTALWLILEACLRQPGRPLAWTDVVRGAERQARLRPIVQELITSGAARLAGLYIDLDGYRPAFMAPLTDLPRKPR
jgi:hypothetical protein